MAELEFDLEKTFDENIETFENYLKSIDPIFTEVLFKHINKIKFAGDSSREPNEGRNEFNECLLRELEGILSNLKE